MDETYKKDILTIDEFIKSQLKRVNPTKIFLMQTNYCLYRKKHLGKNACKECKSLKVCKKFALIFNDILTQYRNKASKFIVYEQDFLIDEEEENNKGEDFFSING